MKQHKKSASLKSFLFFDAVVMTLVLSISALSCVIFYAATLTQQL